MGSPQEGRKHQKAKKRGKKEASGEGRVCQGMKNDCRKTLTLTSVAAAQISLSCCQKKHWQEARKHGKLAGREEASESKEKVKKEASGKGRVRREGRNDHRKQLTLLLAVAARIALSCPENIGRKQESVGK